MLSSIAGGNVPGLLAARMSNAAVQQNIDVAVIKKGQDIEKMQGEAALKLIDSAANVAGSGKIDVYA